MFIKHDGYAAVVKLPISEDLLDELEDSLSSGNDEFDCACLNGDNTLFFVYASDDPDWYDEYDEEEGEEVPDALAKISITLASVLPPSGKIAKKIVAAAADFGVSIEPALIRPFSAQEDDNVDAPMHELTVSQFKENLAETVKIEDFLDEG